MRVLKIVAGFVTNSSSSSAPLVVALKYGLTFADVLRKLGYDVTNPFFQDFVNQLDQKFLRGRIANRPPDHTARATPAGEDDDVDEDDESGDVRDEDGEEIGLPSQYRRGYQISRMSVEVQVWEGGGWTHHVDGFLVDLGWHTDEATFRHLLEDDFVVIESGDARE